MPSRRATGVFKENAHIKWYNFKKYIKCLGFDIYTNKNNIVKWYTLIYCYNAQLAKKVNHGDDKQVINNFDNLKHARSHKIISCIMFIILF